MTSTPPQTSAKRWWTLAALSGSLALAFLDQMNLPVALPTIQKDLTLSSLTVQWLINAYLLTWAVFVLTGGYLADFFGLRRIFSLGLVIFGLSSLANALAFSGWWFILFRAMQGLGTALMLPAAIGIIVSIFPEKQRGKAIGIYSGSAAVFLVLGPLMGGVFTQYLNWRWIYGFNLPIALFSYIVVLWALPKMNVIRAKFDFLGFFFFTVGFPCFILALMQADSWGWRSAITLSLFGFSILSLFIFFYWERVAKHPFLDLSLFKSARFLTANFVFFVVQFVLILPVFWAISLQKFMDKTPMQAGLYIMIAVAPLVIMIPLGGVLCDRFGLRVPVCSGLFLVLISMGWFFFMNPQTALLLIPGMLAFGCGVSLVFAPISSTVVGSVSFEKRGIASGILGCIRQAGGTFGLAVIGSMLMNIRRERFEYLLKTSTHRQVTVTNEQLDCINRKTDQLCGLTGESLEALKQFAFDAYDFAFHWIYLLCALLVLAAFTSTFLIFHRNQKKKLSTTRSRQGKL